MHAFPVMNPIGFEAATRHITLSEEDLNRSFPGNQNGTLAERIANTIFTTIDQTRPDLVVDLHNDWIRSIPYTVLDAPLAVNKTTAEMRVAEIAGSTGFLVVTEPNSMRKTLSHSLLQADVPAITIELGESFVVNEAHVESGVQSILNVLNRMEMIESRERFEHASTHAIADHVKLLYSQEPASSTSGIIRFLVKPGAIVSAGQPVAKIVNAFGKLQETISARTEAIVLGLSDSSVAFPGAPVMAFATLRTKEG